ncbi:MAG: hypothetical protein Q4G14_06550 [Paracoccus sp. (in: a-proteobacteria)]|uniref:hypothetical protein n=1 Tax=Paracoccus sp. TaxID=267 RepID=UPI0026DECE85|nr:hypothetical protein [Paracoccus sp. (in: a-proteobacteria)]MDO5612890.1 hypothetical protein [Paracoccus sp. (in: a-proteobacteria)]
MIPFAPPSLEFVLILLGCLAATLVWIVWLLRLAFFRKARRRMGAGQALAFALLTGIGCSFIWSAYAFQRAFAAYQADNREKYRPVLAQDRRLGGIDMPAGTALVLGIAGQVESFNRADFPHPVLIAGVQTLRVERYLEIQTDENHRRTGFTPKSLRLTGLGESRQEGWLCDAAATVALATHADGSVKAMASCTAAAGNLVEGQPLPEGAEIVATQGALYPDGRRGSDRWLIHLPPEARLQIHGSEQQGGALWLDAERKVVEQFPP